MRNRKKNNRFQNLIYHNRRGWDVVKSHIRIRFPYGAGCAQVMFSSHVMVKAFLSKTVDCGEDQCKCG